MLTKGKHIFTDFIGIKGDENEIGNFVFNLMINSIEKNTAMKIVHSHLSILNGDTPPGFTSVLLLDESHFTSHCYSDQGLLAIDLFTCGKTDTTKVIEYFVDKIKEKYPDIVCTYRKEHERFHNI
jgi:S-adenosylmethionine/arginine decarboxylase-like enzyme